MYRTLSVPQKSVAARVRPGTEDVISPAARSRSISAAPASTNRSTMRVLKALLKREKTTADPYASGPNDPFPGAV
jgi:hypothetical protein